VGLKNQIKSNQVGRQKRCVEMRMEEYSLHYQWQKMRTKRCHPLVEQLKRENHKNEDKIKKGKA